ncbi:hypothetical protein C4K68_11975 [Pokkaliibacter plantistimulans]|uniref:PepSY domain-containing protein n=1 Tax=Proteobacteria bacterium 228 TaxID=2083153 RepID=A0A2S5KR43_9PROT|nr:PepSY-associated TM helix domain-containing protein [Pokkaliibacter plantistimulans]PPC77125.1 hypothetical protein C4K68_11975 [Pokkaliibacter plantistimulans]
MSSINRSQVSQAAALLALITRLHFYIGLFVGPFVLAAALTGTAYVLTPQLEDWLYKDQLTTTATGPAHSLAEQIEVAQAAMAGQGKLFAVRPAPDARATTRVMFSEPGLGDSESRAIFVDPITLAVKGNLVVYGTSGVLPLRSKIDYMHRHLLLGDVGRNYSELAASWLWIAALGGFALWLTGGNKNRSEVAKRNGYLRHRRLHGLTGLWIGLGLLFFSATGLTWSKWAGDRIDSLRSEFGWVTPAVSLQLGSAGAMPMGEHADHQMQAAAPMVSLADPAMFDTILKVARDGGIDAAKIEIRPPKAADKAWMVREVDRSWPTQVDTIAIDGSNLAITSRADFATFSLLPKLIRWGIDAHMGILFGLPNQLLLAAFGLALAVMIVLGYRMWWRRRPQAGATAQTLTHAWQRLNSGWRTAVVLIATGLGWCLPVMGVSLLAFLIVDVMRWRMTASRVQAEGDMA